MEKRNAGGSTATWGAILIGVGVVFLIGQFVPGLGGAISAVVWAGMFILGAGWFYNMYRQQPHNWGLLIPAYVLAAIAGLIGVSTVVGRWAPLLIPAYIMFAIAAPFLYVYLQDTKANWWALIPGGIMGFIGGSFLLASVWQLIPVVMILIGGLILYRSLSGSKAEGAAANPAAAEPTMNGHHQNGATKPATPVAEMRPLAPPAEDK